MRTKSKIRDSFAIDRADYDDNGQVLTVHTTGSHGHPAVLRYAGVPRAVYDELLQSESKGGYFNRNIRNNYTFLD